MLIWIPVDRDDEREAKIIEIFEAKYWALVDFDKGEVTSIRFFNRREEFTEWVDFIVLKNKFEPYMEFMNEGMMVLCVREEESIDEITEAFKFKELDEVGL